MLTSSKLMAAGMTLLAIAPLTLAHMYIDSPKPIGRPKKDPLDATGANFPCQGLVPSESDPVNNWPVGSQQTLHWTSDADPSTWATHGGGSCQMSVTTDTNPTKDSKWKVIYSIEGGCPAADKFEENGGTSIAFNFTIPEEVPSGAYVAAVTWFNHVGNREMYMNCAKVSVDGGKAEQSALDSLPDMAVANIGIGPCKTTQDFDYTFENPGKYVQHGGPGTGPFMPLCGGPQSEAFTPYGAGPGSQTPNASVPAPQAPQATPVPQTPQAPPVSAPASSPSAPIPTPPSPAPATGGNTGGSSTSCSPDGTIVCNGDSQFGICDHGKVVFGPVAAGTKCQNGAIAKRGFVHRAQRTRL